MMNKHNKQQVWVPKSLVKSMAPDIIHLHTDNVQKDITEQSNKGGIPWWPSATEQSQTLDTFSNHEKSSHIVSNEPEPTTKIISYGPVINRRYQNTIRQEPNFIRVVNQSTTKEKDSIYQRRPRYNFVSYRCPIGSKNMALQVNKNKPLNKTTYNDSSTCIASDEQHWAMPNVLEMETMFPSEQVCLHEFSSSSSSYKDASEWPQLSGSLNKSSYQNASEWPQLPGTLKKSTHQNASEWPQILKISSSSSHLDSEHHNTIECQEFHNSSSHQKVSVDKYLHECTTEKKSLISDNSHIPNELCQSSNQNQQTIDAEMEESFAAEMAKYNRYNKFKNLTSFSWLKETNISRFQ
jgi:hypothetical protein